MDIHLRQIGHPDSGVAVNGLTHDDPYFQACWSPLLDPWTVHAVDVSARLTRSSRVRLSLDEFSEALNPEPAGFQVRARTVGRALQDAAEKGFAHVRWSSHVQVEVQLYRQVPLVAGSDLQRLTDPELCAHASAVADVNRRRAAAGHPLLGLAPEVSERVRRADPAFRPPRSSPAEVASARLGQLARSSTNPPGVPSLG